jgi:hypothetical protein
LFEGSIYQFIYNLERHRLFNITLRRWLILLCFILPATMWLGLWRVSVLTAVLATLAAACMLAATWRAGKQRYVRFEEQSQAPALFRGESERVSRTANQQPADSPLPAMSKTRVSATGFFEVSGLRRYLIEAPSEYTTFETREHCVMTQVPRTRFLLLSRSREDEVGWWYIFFQPDTIRSVRSGWLYFGMRPRPALRLEIYRAVDTQDEDLYLSFDDEATRSLVLADLQCDADLT